MLAPVRSPAGTRRIGGVPTAPASVAPVLPEAEAPAPDSEFRPDATAPTDPHRLLKRCQGRAPNGNAGGTAPSDAPACPVWWRDSRR